jgi:hypothetical protein
MKRKLNMIECINKGESVAKICSELNVGKRRVKTGYTIEIILKIISKET